MVQIYTNYTNARAKKREKLKNFFQFINKLDVRVENYIIKKMNVMNNFFSFLFEKIQCQYVDKDKKINSNNYNTHIINIFVHFFRSIFFLIKIRFQNIKSEKNYFPVQISAGLFILHFEDNYFFPRICILSFFFFFYNSFGIIIY